MTGIDLNLIGLFVDIAEAASLSDAARRSGVTRSHISQRLRLLERQLGTELMHRTTRRLELTEAGQTVYEHGVRIREEAEAVASAVGTLARETAGHVRLSMPTGLGRVIVAPLLLAFQTRHPNVSLSVLFSNNVDDLVSSQVNIALKIVHKVPDTLTGWELSPIPWTLCAAPIYLADKPPILEARDLAGHAFIYTPTFNRRVVLNTGQGRIAMSPRLQSEDFSFLATAVEAGIGIALLPNYMVAHALAEGRLSHVLPGMAIENGGGKLFLLTTPTDYPTVAQRVVAQFLRRELTELMAAALAQPLPR